MSKRIFTVILALVLSLTALSFGAEAEWTGAQLTYDESIRILRLRWDECEGAVRYVASIYTSNDNPVYSRSFEAGEYKELSYSVSGGTYYGEVAAYNESGAKIATSTTEKITLPMITTIGSLTLKRDGDGTVTLSWKEVSKAESYVVNVVYMNDENFLQGSSVNVGLASSYVITEAPYEKLYQITVSYLDIDNRNTTVGTMTLSSYTGGYNSYGGGIYVTINTSALATVTWNPVSYATGYKVQYVTDGQTYTKDCSVSENYIQLDYSKGLQVTVSYVYNGSTYAIGTASISAAGVVTYGGTTSNPGGINVTGSNCTMNVGATSSVIYWNPVSGANYYQVIYTNNVTNTSYNLHTYVTNATIPFGANNCNSFSVVVFSVSSSGNSVVATVRYNGTSSGQTPTPTVCEHTFEYQSCTEVHWKHCTKCGYTCEVGEHSAANGSCSVCGRSSTTSRFDVNGDGQVNLQDAVMILRRLAHLD